MYFCSAQSLIGVTSDNESVTYIAFTIRFVLDLLKSRKFQIQKRTLQRRCS